MSTIDGSIIREGTIDVDKFTTDAQNRTMLVPTIIPDSDNLAFTSSYVTADGSTDRSYTSISGVGERQVVVFEKTGVGNIDFDSCPNILYKDDVIARGNNRYLLSVLNVGTDGSPSYMIFSNPCNARDGNVWNPSSTVLDENENFNDYTTVGNIALVFSGTPRDRVEKVVRATFNGSHTFTVPSGTVFRYLSDAGNSFTNGNAPIAGTYDVLMSYVNSEYRVVLSERTVIA